MESTCAACRFGFTPILHSHHIRPRSDGGHNHASNRVLLCPNCHALVHELYKWSQCANSGEFDHYYENFSALKEWICKNLGEEVYENLADLHYRRRYIGDDPPCN